MKKLLAISLLLSIPLLAQNPNWTSLKTTNINFSNSNSFDMFSNGYGLHIIVQENNSLKYFKMDVNGNAGNAITIDSTSVVSPSICGDNNRLYIVYRKSNENYIRAKYSSNGGSSWSNISTLNYNANSIESVFSNNKLHITFDVSNVTYYSYYNTENPGWSALQPVSVGENGSLPRIAAWYTGSQDRVIFLYKRTDTESRWREWNASTNTWVNNPQTAFTVTSDKISFPVGFAVDANYIYLFYEFYTFDPFNIYSQWQKRSRVNNIVEFISYPQPELLVPRIYSTTTIDNVTHTAFFYNGILENGYEIGIMRNKHTGSGIVADPAYPFNYYGFEQPSIINISSASRDVFILWKDGLSDYLKLVYDDQAPLAPQNPQLSANPGDNKVRVSWSKNNEPDVAIYEVWRKVAELGGSWTNLGTTTNNYFVDNEYLYAPGAGDFTLTYKIRAKDIGNHYSEFSQGVTTRGEYLGKGLITANTSDYRLNENYPNPFNPTTVISWQTAVGSHQTLKIYDILGREVATLVDEYREAGSYEVDFNAENLPSGVYIYKLQAGSFTDVKKMILSK